MRPKWKKLNDGRVGKELRITDSISLTVFLPRGFKDPDWIWVAKMDRWRGVEKSIFEAQAASFHFLKRELKLALEQIELMETRPTH